MAQPIKPFNLGRPVNAKSVTPRQVKVSMEDIKDVTKKTRRLGAWFKVGLGLLALGAVGAAVAVPVVMTMKKDAGSSTMTSSTVTTATVTTETTTTATTSTVTTATTTTTTTSTTTTATTTTTRTTTSVSMTTTATTTATTSSTTSATTTTTKTTTSVLLNSTANATASTTIVTTAASATVVTTVTTATTVTTTATTTSVTTDTTSITTTTTDTTTTETVVCNSPYAITPNNTCVNILIDINNCGAVGNACGSSYTSCSGGTCSSAPAVQLSNSNFIWTAAVNGSVDDAYFGVEIPFNITLYSTMTNYVYVSSNGVLCLGACSSAYTETSLPTGTFPDATVFGYWDDLYIYSGTSQGIYYATEGNAPNRTLTFEYYTSHFGASNQYYHFQVIFFEAAPGVVQTIYFDSTDGGSSCTIGVQSSGSGSDIQYTYDIANSVTQNMTIVFDSNAGTSSLPAMG